MCSSDLRKFADAVYGVVIIESEDEMTGGCKRICFTNQF